MKRPRLVLSCLIGLSLAPLGAPALGLVAGCNNHDSLAPDPDAGTSTHSSAASTGASTGSMGAGGATPVEPDGPTRLTLVAGVVDAPATAFCFASYPSGTASKSPFPAGGLAFAHALVVPLPSDDIPSGDVLLSIVTGDLASIGSLTCGEILADPSAHPTLTIVSMGVLPSTTLTAKRSLLLAPMGCIGGATHQDANQEAICGKGYTPDTPTINLLAAPLSRLTDPAHLAFQGVNASTAIERANLYLTPTFAGSPDALVVDTLAPGGAGPFPPFTKLSIADLGSVSGSNIGIAPSPSPTPVVRKSFSDALALAGLSSTDVLNGKGFALVAVGAGPSVGMGSWWNDFTFVAVSSDPP